MRSYESHLPEEPRDVREQPAARPLITAAITAYNSADSIEQAVESARSQSWQPLEVLVVDDHSTDRTPEILTELASRYPEVRVVRHGRNRGVAAARNTLIREAQGEAIAFFDDDDTSHPDRILHQWERLIAAEACFGPTARVLCIVSRTAIDSAGNQEYRRALASDPGHPGVPGADLVAHLLWGARIDDESRGVTGTGGHLARLETYRALGGFDDRLRRTEDLDQEVRHARAGGVFVGVEAPLLQHRVTNTADKTLEHALPMHLLFLATHREAFPNDAVYAATRRWWQAWYLLRAGETATGLRCMTAALVLAPRVTLGRLIRELAPRIHSNLRRGLPVRSPDQVR